jgi:hypothetical protein
MKPMNEPLITLHETKDGRAVRRFADGDSAHGPRVRPDVGRLRYAIPALAKAGFRRLARR